ncbi:MAG: hypothetical protein A07HR60_02315 [uncultured archaeon A07HR60]|nr:MAG: hypothetical protein A07HR60_02315 [uncultured archaeon A07HR60]
MTGMSWLKSHGTRSNPGISVLVHIHFLSTIVCESHRITTIVPDGTALTPVTFGIRICPTPGVQRHLGADFKREPIGKFVRMVRLV